MPKLPTAQEVKNYVYEHPKVLEVLAWARRRSFPGFFGIPVYTVVLFIVREMQRTAIQTRANSMAFSFFLALFPSLILLLTLVPFFSRFFVFWEPTSERSLMQIMLREFQEILPGTAGEMVTDTFYQLNEIHGTLLSVGFFLAIYFASNGMIDMMRSFEKRYRRTFKRRTWLRKRMVAIGLLFQLGALLLISTILFIMGDTAIGWITERFALSFGAKFILQLFRWLIIILLIYSGFATLYRYGASTYQRFKWLSPGASMATILGVLVSVGFSFYVDNFGTYNRVYGSIGTIIVLMLWIQLNCYILLIGFELNASIAVQRDRQTKPKRHRDLPTSGEEE